MECGSRNVELGIRKWECGLRPVGAIEAYAPEGMANSECGMGKAEVVIRKAEWRSGKQWAPRSGDIRMNGF